MASTASLGATGRACAARAVGIAGPAGTAGIAGMAGRAADGMIAPLHTASIAVARIINCNIYNVIYYYM